MAQLLADVDDATLKELLMNLGARHRPDSQAFATAAKVQDRPVAIMAYTIKGWGLPIAGHIDNHARNSRRRIRPCRASRHCRGARVGRL